MRTFAVSTERDGVLISCGLMAVEPHVVGVLAGHPDDPQEPIWLNAPDGRRLSIVWPEGFRVTFSPTLTLHDETGRIAAQGGDRVELNQVRPDSAAGTYDDPYIASCDLFGKTYPFVR